MKSSSRIPFGLKKMGAGYSKIGLSCYGLGAKSMRAKRTICCFAVHFSIRALFSIFRKNSSYIEKWNSSLDMRCQINKRKSEDNLWKDPFCKAELMFLIRSLQVYRWVPIWWHWKGINHSVIQWSRRRLEKFLLRNIQLTVGTKTARSICIEMY